MKSSVCYLTSRLVRYLIGQLGAQRFERIQDGVFNPALEAANSVEGLCQFVGVTGCGGCRRQVGRAETAQQQRQEETENLETAEPT